MKVTATTLRVVLLEDGSAPTLGLRHALEADGDIVVQASIPAADGPAAVRRLHPDAVVLHTLPGTLPYRTVERLMARSPRPVLVVYAGTADSRSEMRSRMLSAGCLAVIERPGPDSSRTDRLIRQQLRALAQVKVIRHIRGLAAVEDGPAVVAIAASTGGPDAVSRLLVQLATLEAPILLVQHLPREFVTGFTAWVGRTAPLAVQAATDGIRIHPGTVYIAPADTHLKLGPGRALALTDQPESIHRPSADVLFQSMARHAGASGIGIILTGMGEDGAAGLLAMRESGAFTIAQDEKSSAIYGMPRAAVLLGAAEVQLPLAEMGSAILARAAR